MSSLHPLTLPYLKNNEDESFTDAGSYSTDDPFEDFDVASGSEKDFLIEHLRTDAPEAERLNFRQAQVSRLGNPCSSMKHLRGKANTNRPDESCRRAMVDDLGLIKVERIENFIQNVEHGGIGARPYANEQVNVAKSAWSGLEFPIPRHVLQEMIGNFARSHTFNINKVMKPTTLQRQEYTRDIYDYAHALGLRKHEATVEVSRASATYRRDRRLRGRFELDQSDDKFALGFKGNDAAEHVTSMDNWVVKCPIGVPKTLCDAKNDFGINTPHAKSGKHGRNRVGNPALWPKPVATRADGQPSMARKNSQESIEGKKLIGQLRTFGDNIFDIADPATNDEDIQRGFEEWKRENLGVLDAQIDFTTANHPAGHVTPNMSTFNSNSPSAVVDTSKNARPVCSTLENETESGIPRHMKLKPRRTTHLEFFPSALRDTSIQKTRKCKGRWNVFNDQMTAVSKYFPSPDRQQADFEDQPAQLQSTITISEYNDEGKPQKSHKDTNNAANGAETTNSTSRPFSELTVVNASIPEKKLPKHCQNNDQVFASGNLFLDNQQPSQYSNNEPTITQDKNLMGSGEILEIDPIYPGLCRSNGKALVHHEIQISTPAPSLNDEAEDQSSNIRVLTQVRDYATLNRYETAKSSHSGPLPDNLDVEHATPKRKFSCGGGREENFEIPCSFKSRRTVAVQPNINILPTKKPPLVTKSPFFSLPPSAEKQKRVGNMSCIPFPPLTAPSFGLLQEKLAHNPFRLLVGVTFLNRTKGRNAIPVFFSLMEKYPSPEAILAAPKSEVIALTYHLGFQSRRAETYRKLAYHFLHDPPVKGKRYRVDHYPTARSGMDIEPFAVLGDDDPRDAWEIGHITKGRYAIDSWRIFCRDILRGVAAGWNGEGIVAEHNFQPEWMRVQPQDKELIAFLRWMWLREGFTWDPNTGDKEVAGTEIMRAAAEGRLIWDGEGVMTIANSNTEVLDA